MHTRAACSALYTSAVYWQRRSSSTTTSEEPSTGRSRSYLSLASVGCGISSCLSAARVSHTPRKEGDQHTAKSSVLEVNFLDFLGESVNTVENVVWLLLLALFGLHSGSGQAKRGVRRKAPTGIVFSVVRRGRGELVMTISPSGTVRNSRTAAFLTWHAAR